MARAVIRSGMEQLQRVKAAIPELTQITDEFCATEDAAGLARFLRNNPFRLGDAQDAISTLLRKKSLPDTAKNELRLLLQEKPENIPFPTIVEELGKIHTQTREKLLAATCPDTFAYRTPDSETIFDIPNIPVQGNTEKIPLLLMMWILATAGQGMPPLSSAFYENARYDADFLQTHIGNGGEKVAVFIERTLTDFYQQVDGVSGTTGSYERMYVLPLKENIARLIEEKRELLGRFAAAKLPPGCKEAQETAQLALELIGFDVTTEGELVATPERTASKLDQARDAVGDALHTAGMKPIDGHHDCNTIQKCLPHVTLQVPNALLELYPDR